MGNQTALNGEMMIENEDTLSGKYLLFAIEGKEYAIEIVHVFDIVDIEPITVVPGVPANIRGMISLRGTIVPVMDVRMRFGRQPAPYNDRTCIIVLEYRNIKVGIIVDELQEVSSITESDIITPSQRKREGDMRFIKDIARIDTRTIMLIDCARLLSQDGFDVDEVDFTDGR